MNNEKIRVVRGSLMQNKSVETIVGSITAGILQGKGKILLHNPSNNTGYQRKQNDKRVEEIVQGITDKRVDLPTAILLNAREKPEEVLSGGDDNLMFDISKTKHLYVVDGQHRYSAINALLQDKIIPPSYKIPFVCMVGADQDEELWQFYSVNSNAKSVATDLALGLLKRRAHREDRTGTTHRGVREIMSGKGTEWKILGQELTEKLDSSSSVWKDRVLFANQAKKDKKNAVVRSTSMVNSFDRIARNDYFAGLDREHQSQILDAYWKGIQEIIPDAFSSGRKFSIQKGLGVRVMHGVFSDVMERVRAKNQTLFSPQNYAAILREPLQDLRGPNFHGQPVEGADFWAEGKEGGVASYNGSVGIKMLADKIRRSLPSIQPPNIK